MFMVMVTFHQIVDRHYLLLAQLHQVSIRKAPVTPTFAELEGAVSSDDTPPTRKEMVRHLIDEIDGGSPDSNPGSMTKQSFKVNKPEFECRQRKC